MSDRENWWLPSGMLLLELTAAVFGFVLAHRVSQTAQLADWGDVKVRSFRLRRPPSSWSRLTLSLSQWLLYTWLSAGVLCDILITCVQTFVARAGLPRAVELTFPSPCPPFPPLPASSPHLQRRHRLLRHHRPSTRTGPGDERQALSLVRPSPLLLAL